MTSRLSRRTRRVASLTAVMLLTVVGVAYASTVQYWSGVTRNREGPWHPITNTTVGSVYGGFSCTGANDASHDPVGTAYCITGAGNTTTHPYNGTYRFGWCGVADSSKPDANMNCRETW